LKLKLENKALEWEELRIHHFEPASRANGPGLRFVVWVQGCSLGCPGCFNPETHPNEAGKVVPVQKLAELVFGEAGKIDGVTISGGEPFQQLKALTHFLKILKTNSSLSTVVFTGFSWEEIQRIQGVERALASIDVLLAGRYQKDRRIAKGLLGSSNKTIHFFSKLYSTQDLDRIPEAEVLIKPDGEIFTTGIDPLMRIR
jgi:anaerobic ribonucleoside-triphosphate reductase activating protein